MEREMEGGRDVGATRGERAGHDVRDESEKKRVDREKES